MMEENYPINRPADKKHIPRWGIWFLIPLLSGLCVLFALSIEWKETLKIQRIVVQGARIIPARDIFTLANISSKSSMYDLDVFDVRQRLLTQPFIKYVNINRQLPDALSIFITEREPIASLSGNKLRYVDQDCVLLPYLQLPVQFDLPIISGIEGLESGITGTSIPNDKLAEAINVLKSAIAIDSAVYHMISEVNMSDNNDVILYTTDSGVQIKIGRGEYLKKFLTLQTFWANFVKTGDAAKLAYIDLRFDGQVVVKWNLEPETQTLKWPL